MMEECKRLNQPLTLPLPYGLHTYISSLPQKSLLPSKTLELPILHCFLPNFFVSFNPLNSFPPARNHLSQFHEKKKKKKKKKKKTNNKKTLIKNKHSQKKTY
eukprot:TRINITY_DN4250_c0_g1_i10.p4 TRINITY_DN4250_c0_g1~~TRINITY_DN4250_c0_g1_i10.p4  ORF type:complete len:102 (-),score=23.10 TRINITY_DN4250_c0_g1_i10:91-396(-)